MKHIERKTMNSEIKKICNIRQIIFFLLFFSLISGIGVTAENVTGFNAIPTTGSAPLMVSFIDQSPVTANITNYLWDFGDGSNKSTQKNPVHTYMGVGIYNVSLTVTDNKGVNATITKSAYIHVQPSDYPVVKFITISQNGTAPQTVYFIDQSELDPAVPDEMYNYIWNFGDGTAPDISNSRTIQHRYTRQGLYTAELQIQDQNGAKYNSAVPAIINITNGTKAVSALFAAVPVIGPAPLTVSFIDQSKSPVFITDYAWDFGDGSNISPEQNPIHTYEGTGTYNVSLTITNTDDIKVTTAKSSYIHVQPSEYPGVRFTAIPQNGTAPLIVYFIDQSELDPAVPDEMYNYIWNFGDGITSNTSNPRNPQHKYSKPGEYTANLQIQDQSGANYNSPAPIKINISSISHIITAKASPNGTITPSGQVYVMDGSDQAFNITPDSGYIILDVKVDNKSVGSVPGYIFHSVTSNHTIYANFAVNKPPVANFTADKTSGYVPLTVQFTDTSKGSPVSWSWTFGDGGTSQTKNPVHTYTTAGLFNVNFTVSNSCGSDTKSAQNFINASRKLTPDANFTYTPSIVDVNQNVSFFSYVSGPELDPLLWNFGDSLPSVTAINPVYQYQYPGKYNVTLTVTNPYGKAVAMQTVPVRGLIPDFEIRPEEWAFMNTTVTFRDTSKGTPVQWFWDFGDGTSLNTTSNVTTHSYSKAGIYSITMTATNWQPITASRSKRYAIFEKSVPRFVDFDLPLLKQTGKAPFTVEFKDITPIQSNVSAWLWDFGDGANSLEQTPTHTYTVPGQYTVILTVRNEMGTNEARKVALIIVT